VKDIQYDQVHPADTFQWDSGKHENHVVKIYLTKRSSDGNLATDQLEIGKISSQGDLVTFKIKQLPVMKVLIDQQKYDTISSELTDEKLCEVFEGIITTRN